MKQIIAIVKPFLVEKILDALRRAPLEAVSVAEVKGMGKQKSYLDRYADTEYARTFLPKVEITVWVDDLRAEDVARKIVEVARTGRMGDGKIFILPAEPYEAVIDIRRVAACLTGSTGSTGCMMEGGPVTPRRTPRLILSLL